MARIRKAREAARALLDELGIDTVPVPVDWIAEQLGANVMYPSELSDNVSGVLVPTGAGRWIIGVNASHAETRQRFTIAHEIGHLRLHGYTTPHADGQYLLRMRNERSSDGSVDEEIEANQFAAELLMPAGVLRREVANSRIEYAAWDGEHYDPDIELLARKFRVSKQSLTLRLSSLGLL